MLKILQINYQGFNIKAFSLLEIIIAIILIVLITSFALPKYNAIIDSSNLSLLKSDLSLIQSGIEQKKTINTLLSNGDKIENLDYSAIDKINEKLFTKVIEFSITSTDTKEKKLGKWSKISDNSYEFYLSSSKSILFLYENEKESILNNHIKKEGNYDVLVIQKTAKQIVLRSGKRIVGILNKSFGVNPLEEPKTTNSPLIKREVINAK